ncbi:hypothetical protein JCM9279_003803 [Rhodotorula babjevae]
MARSRSRSDVDRTPTSDQLPSSTSATSSAPYPPPPDLFLLCRPPPSSSRHELDVQVQLVQPADLASRRSAPEAPLARPDTPASTAGRSFDAVAGAQVGGKAGAGSQSGEDDDEGQQQQHARTPRSRSPSVSSTRSGTSRDSTYTAGTSASGRSASASTSGGGGGGAGGKRRIVPLLALEYHTLLPTTVNDAGTGQRVARFHRRGIELTGVTMLGPVYLSSATATTSPSSSPNAAATAAVPEPSSPAFLAVPGTASPHKPDSGFFTKLKRRSATLSAGVGAVPSSPTTSSSSTSAPSGDSLPASPHLLSLVRTPSLDRPGDPARPAGYAFLLRKWLRADLVDAPRTVRVEWTRAPLRRRPVSLRRPRSEVSAGQGPASAPQSRRGSETGHAAGAGAGVEGEDDEGEPDEEEEERAWLCSLVYPLSGVAASPSLAASGSGSASQASSPAPSPPLGSSSGGFLLPPSASSSSPSSTAAAPSSTRRLLLATLRPAPHHPKLVSTLLLPPSLPSIPLGAFHPQRGLVGGALAPEDLRDLAMVTALWVAVRERLGGLEGVAVGEGLGGAGAGAGTAGGSTLGLAASRSAAPEAHEGAAAQGGGGGGGAGGVAAQLTEKAGLALQTGTKRASRASGFVGRLFGAR